MQPQPRPPWSWRIRGPVVAGNNIVMQVTTSNPITGTFTLPLTISDRASSGIVAGDFTGGLSQSVSATFSNSDTATVTIATTRFGTRKTFTITLGSGAGYTVGTKNTADGTILAATPILSLRAAPAAVTAGTSISLVVTSDIALNRTLRLNLSLDGRDLTGSVLSNGVVPADFVRGRPTTSGVAVTGTLNATFSSSTTATVSIPTISDGDTAAERYRVRLLAGSGYTVDSSRNSILGTINP